MYTMKRVMEINNLMLASTYQSKDTKKYEELWTKIRDLIRWKTDNSDDCDEKYMKIKFNSGNIYYPQVFLDEYLL